MRKKRNVKSEVNGARADSETGSSLPNVTLNVPDAGVVRPMTPTTEPVVGEGAVSARAGTGNSREGETRRGEQKRQWGEATATGAAEDRGYMEWLVKPPCRLATTPQAHGLSHDDANLKSSEKNAEGRLRRGARHLRRPRGPRPAPRPTPSPPSCPPPPSSPITRSPRAPDPSPSPAAPAARTRHAARG